MLMILFFQKAIRDFHGGKLLCMIISLAYQKQRCIPCDRQVTSLCQPQQNYWFCVIIQMANDVKPTGNETVCSNFTQETKRPD